MHSFHFCFNEFFFSCFIGRTALHIACEYDNINVVEELVQANALPNIRAKDGSTALHVNTFLLNQKILVFK